MVEPEEEARGEEGGRAMPNSEDAVVDGRECRSGWRTKCYG